MSAMPIPNTINLVARCWTVAEEIVRSNVRTTYLNPNEEFVTEMLHGDFRKQLHEATTTGLIEEAFLLDLRRHFPDLTTNSRLHSISEGLFADSVLHNKTQEGKSGGDLGLIISRPSFTRSYYSSSRLHLNFEIRGLLCQAKIRRKTGKWGPLTRNQEKLYNDRMEYLSLLLYDFEDKARTILKPFLWKLCRDTPLEAIKQSITSDCFSGTIDSETVIRALGENIIGTEDQVALDQVIAAVRKRVITIIIDWPPDRRPPDDVFVPVGERAGQREQIRVSY